MLGRKLPWVGGAIVDGVGCIATACAGGLGSMVSARLLMGAGSAVGGSATTAYAMDVLSIYPKHTGEAVFLFYPAVLLFSRCSPSTRSTRGGCSAR